MFRRVKNNDSIRVLPDKEKLEFVSISVLWIQGQDIMDNCFILNFGYEAPLPWPQVLCFIIFQFRQYCPKYL